MRPFPFHIDILNVRMPVMYCDSNSRRNQGGCQGRIGVTFDGFLRHRAKGASTPDLASACVLCPLNRWVLYFKMGGGDGVNERRSRVYWTRVSGGGYNEWRS